MLMVMERDDDGVDDGDDDDGVDDDDDDDGGSGGETDVYNDMTLTTK